MTEKREREKEERKERGREREIEREKAKERRVGRASSIFTAGFTDVACRSTYRGRNGFHP